MLVAGGARRNIGGSRASYYDLLVQRLREHNLRQIRFSGTWICAGMDACRIRDVAWEMERTVA